MRILRALPALFFGLIFAGGGLFFLSETAGVTWRDWSEMQRWQPVQAELIQVSGGESETLARYRYRWNGESFEGGRVYIAPFNDNIGDYHTQLQRRLREIERRDAPLPIWVNPADPSQAVIDREMRWGLFALMAGFCSLFIIIGLWVASIGLRKPSKTAGSERPSLMAMRREWREASKDPAFSDGFLEYSGRRIAEHQRTSAGQSDAPPADWQGRKGWQTAEIRSNVMAGMATFWFMAIAFSAASAALLYAIPGELRQGNYPILIALVFPLAALFLLYSAIRRTLEFARFGRVIFQMAPYPGAIGGEVGGRILLPRLDRPTPPSATPGMPGASSWKISLECIYSYVSGSGKNRSRHERIRWSEEGQPGLEQTPLGTSLSFRFDIPNDLPQADVKQSGNYTFWRLSVKGDLPGVDLDRQYNIPVFPGNGQSNPAYASISEQAAQRREEESDAIRESIQRGDFDRSGLTGVMRVQHQGDTIRLAFPMFRNKLLTLFAAIFAGGFGFASVMMLRGMLDGGFFGVVIGLFSIPFVLVGLFAAVATIYLPFNNLRVEIDRQGIKVLRRLLFIPIQRKQLAASEIRRLSIKQSGSTGQGAKQVEEFKVLAHYGHGKTLTLAENLEGADAAGHFRDYLAGHLGVQ